MGVQVYSFPQKPNVKIPVRPGKRLQLIGTEHLEDHRVTLSLSKFSIV